MNKHFIAQLRTLPLLLGLVPVGLLQAFVALPGPDFDPGNQQSPDSPDGAWHRLDRIPVEISARPAWVRPANGRPFRLTDSALRASLDGAPQEGTASARAARPIIHLPMPDGSYARFRFVEAPVMAPALASKFPEIKTYLGTGVDDPAAGVRFDLTPAGFHAQVLSPQGAVYIDPYTQGDAEHYTSTFKRDYARSADGFLCLANSPFTVSAASIEPRDIVLRSSGNQLRTYRLAVAATAEYTAFHGGTIAAGMAAIVTAINRVTGIYETELAIRFVLIANNDLLVYTSASTDPYDNGNGSAMLGQNQANIDAVIGSPNYDIGHVFSTGGGGIASLGVVCRSGLKANGVTGLSSPVGDAFYIDYVAHEMGHQFGANHPFNSTSGSCSGNRVASSAYEPGSGSTIMAYAGLCSPDNLQGHSDAYFHWKSYDEIMAYVSGTGGSCADVTTTGNNAPTVSAGPNYTIPRNTPFTLTAIGSDPDGDPLSYCWEEGDLGAAQLLNDPDNGTSPLFRSFPGVTNFSRTFPKLASILSGGGSQGERLPSTSRTMSFRVTARDDRPDGGGVNNADMQVTVTAGAGPFLVTSPNTAGTWSGLRTVTWDVAGTATPPVAAAFVNILLSTDGGNTFPFLLVSNTPNDGAAQVLLPNVSSSAARIKVAAADNIFFDISDANFSVVPGPPQPFVQITSATLAAEDCAPGNGALDPGETVTINLALRNTGTANTTNLVVALLDQPGVTNFTPPRTYGALIAGGTTITQSFTFAAGGTCGGTLAAAFQLQDGASSLGILTNFFGLGTVVTSVNSKTNGSALTIPVTGTRGPASAYPLSVNLTGVGGAVTKVTVTLRGLTHSRPDDLDVLLVGPGGQTVMLMSDVGGTVTPINNLTLTFDDAAANSLPDGSTFSSGVWKPTNVGTTDAMDAGPPSGPYGTSLNIFNGTSPNGTWSLYVDDDSSFGGGSGSLAQGWSINVITTNTVCCHFLLADNFIKAQPASLTTNVGSIVALSYAVTNAGPDSANGVIFSNIIPAGLQLISASSTVGSCTGDNGAVLGALGTLAPGAGGVVTLNFQALTSGSITNFAALISSTDDPDSNNNMTGTVLTINSVPFISATPNQSLPEDSTLGPLAFAVADAETPANFLTVRATSSNPAIITTNGMVLGGAGIDRSVTFTPLPNANGVATINLIVSDGMGEATNSFSLTVQPVNDPPVLAPISNTSVNEGSLLSFPVDASDVDSPLSELIFSLGPGTPSGASMTTHGGAFTWTPSEAQGPGTNTISVIVSDSGSPSLSATQTFQVVVSEVNSPPTFVPLAEQTILQGTTLTVTNAATDADIPTNTIAFSLGAGAPAGAELDSASGVLTWMPGLADVGTNTLQVIVTDNATPALSATQSLVIVVTQANRPPTIDPVGTQTVAEGSPLVVTNIAHDLNTPPGQLTFSLGTGAPAGAAVNATNGVFTWTPSEDQGPSTNSISVIATDSISPALTATQTFIVIVTEVNAAPQLTLPASQLVYEGVPISVNATATDSDLPTNKLTFALMAGALPGASINATNGLFTWTPGPADVGTTNTLQVTVTDDGQPPLVDTRSFTITVIGRPVIEAITVINGTVTLTWQTIAGRSYRVQSKQSLQDADWTDLPGDVTAQGPRASKSDAFGAGTRFYRVRVLDQ